MATHKNGKPENSKPARAKQHFYSVSIRADKKKDNTRDTQRAMAKVKALAASMDFADAVEIKTDGETFTRLGIFFMNAPEKFADQVKDLDNIVEVKKPAERKSAPVRKGRGRRR